MGVLPLPLFLSLSIRLRTDLLVNLRSVSLSFYHTLPLPLLYIDCEM